MPAIMWRMGRSDRYDDPASTRDLDPDDWLVVVRTLTTPRGRTTSSSVTGWCSTPTRAPPTDRLTPSPCARAHVRAAGPDEDVGGDVLVEADPHEPRHGLVLPLRMLVPTMFLACWLPRRTAAPAQDLGRCSDPLCQRRHVASS
jgi:hypothetical protein